MSEKSDHIPAVIINASSETKTYRSHRALAAAALAVAGVSLVVGCSADSLESGAGHAVTAIRAALPGNGHPDGKSVTKTSKGATRHGHDRAVMPALHRNLIALGGSITAGAGLRSSYEPGIDSCRRSDESYPALIARQTNMNLIQEACGGAKTSAGILTSQHTTEGIILEPQLEAIKPYVKQSDVVIMVGANDFHEMADSVECMEKGCPQLTPVRIEHRLKDEAEVAANMTTIVRQLYRDGAHEVVVNEYYADAWGGSDCLKRPLTAYDQAYMHAELVDVNTAITNSVTAAGGIIAVPLWKDHGVCAAEPWVSAPGHAAPGHPTAAGQRALASLDERILANA